MSSQKSRRSFLKSSAISFGAGAIAATPIVGVKAAQAASLQQGSGKLQEVLGRGKLIVGTGSTNPPWHFEDEKGQLTGFDIELAKMLAKGLFADPTKVEFVREASDARIPNLQTNQVDIVFQFMTVTA